MNASGFSPHHIIRVLSVWSECRFAFTSQVLADDLCRASSLDEAKRWFESSTVICKFVPGGTERAEKVYQQLWKLCISLTPMIPADFRNICTAIGSVCPDLTVSFGWLLSPLLSTGSSSNLCIPGLASRLSLFGVTYCTLIFWSWHLPMFHSRFRCLIFVSLHLLLSSIRTSSVFRQTILIMVWIPIFLR